MADLPRETLHLPLFENTYRVWATQRVAQQQSGRFITGEVLTSGYLEVDRVTMNQKTQMMLPIVGNGDSRPSIYRLYSTGAYFDFVNNVDMRHAQTTINNYLKAAVPWVERQGSGGYDEMIDCIQQLCELNDELISRLRGSGYSVDQANFFKFFRTVKADPLQDLEGVQRSALSDVVRQLRYRRGV